jgi:hypothetical protein
MPDSGIHTVKRSEALCTSYSRIFLWRTRGAFCGSWLRRLLCFNRGRDPQSGKLLLCRHHVKGTGPGSVELDDRVALRHGEVVKACRDHDVTPGRQRLHL